MIYFNNSTVNVLQRCESLNVLLFVVTIPTLSK